MPRPRLQRAATARQEKIVIGTEVSNKHTQIQFPIAEQNFLLPLLLSHNLPPPNVH
jgi:hypothetical protein